MTKIFNRFCSWASKLAGRAITFVMAVVFVLVWAATGPIFHWSDTWQLVINTSTTIITFLLVFLIQNQQNRDGVAIQLKLDELIKATAKANNAYRRVEDLTEEELLILREGKLPVAG